MPGEEIEEPYWPGTKNSRANKIWLSAPVRELVGEGAAGAVFPPVSRQRLANPMAKIWKSMDMPRATPHDLRRTFATTAARLGFPDALIHRVLNHTPGKLSRIYNQHKYEQESRKLMDAVAAKLLGIISGTDVEADNVVEFRK
jgi:integrase